MSLQRVSAVTLIYFFLRSLSQFIRQASNFIPVIILFLAAGAELRGTIAILIAILLPLLLLTYTLLSWWFFRYHVSEQALHLRQGIVRRKQLTLDFDRIQQADVREPWYFRPFNLAILGLESAGSDAQEVELAGLSVARAHALKEQMLNLGQSENKTEQSEVTQDAPAARRLLQLRASEIARYGLIHNPILLFIPILAYPLSQANILEDQVMPYVDELFNDFEQWALQDQAWIMIALIVLVVITAIFGLSILIALMRYYRFTLYKHPQRYEARMGLLNVTSRSFQAHRLQRVTIQQNAQAKLLGRVSMQINQSGQGPQSQHDKIFFIPVLDNAHANLIHHELSLEEPHWQRCHPASCILPWLLTSISISALVWLMSGLEATPALHAMWISAAIGIPIQWMRWRKVGLFLGEHWLALRHGFVGQQQRFIPAVKIQQLSVYQGPWLRLWGCASIQIYSAAGRETLSWYREHDINALQQTLLQRSAFYRGRWM